MAVLGQLASADASQDSRGQVRRKLHLEAGASSEGVEGVLTVIHDLSTTGLLIETAANLTDGELIEVSVPQVGVRTAKVVWSNVHMFGCEFTEDLPAGWMSAALLRASFDSPAASEAALAHDAQGTRWSRRARSSTIIGLAIVAWAVFAGLIAWALGLVFG